MLSIIGLGLNEKSLSLEGLEILNKCNEIYLESYTVDFPYKKSEIEKIILKNIISLDRKDIESDFLIKKAKRSNVALLVYGSPLFATTHTSLIKEAKDKGIKVKVLFNSSVFDSISITGLQLYKFGKITSMPSWSLEKNKEYKPTSFIDVVEENNKINAHTLILIDIGLDPLKAINQLNESGITKGIKINQIIICSKLGTKKQKVLYGDYNSLKNKINLVKPPFCFIIPSKMHFFEQEFLETYFKE